MNYDDLAQMAGHETWLDYQVETFDDWRSQASMRACLYYRTGAGKSITSLAMLHLVGEKEAVVIAPPSTHDTWQKQAEQLDMHVDCISHAKFRQPGYKLSRTRAIIADEFHMFGGHGGAGFKKFDTMARHLQAPLILCSATPNYNDAERVYCIGHVLDPHEFKGGYLAFLAKHCNTMPNHFGATPLVDEANPFKHYDSAENFLRDLPGVYHVPDNVSFTIVDHEVDTVLPQEMETYGYNRRDHKMIASQMERRHTDVQQRLINDDGFLNEDVYAELIRIVEGEMKPVIFFANHATVATALSLTMFANRVEHGLVDGSLTTKTKARVIDAFRKGDLEFLIGTASLATGTDGLDKVSDMLIILDDTDDDALRRQLIGRIMPRGADVDASMKQVHRIVLSPDFG
jgi:hypothetical protein